MIIHDEDDRILAMSAGWTRLSGYTIDDIPTISAWTERAYGDRRAFAKEYIDKLFELEETANNGEWSIQTKDGGKRVWEFFTTPLRQSGGARRRLLSIAIDQTERRSAEDEVTGLNEGLAHRVEERSAQLRQSDERYRLIVDSVRDYAIIMLDPKGNIVSWNPGAQRLKGWSDAEIVGRHFAAFYPSDQETTPGLHLQAALSAGRLEEEGWRVRKDGSRFWANVIITPVKDASGTVLGFAKVTRDLTELRRAEDALQLANRELEAFSYSVAHHLRAPLRGMNGFANVLLEDYGDKLDAEGRDCLQEIHSNASRMGDLIDALLSLSRVTRNEIEPSRVNLGELARAAIRDLAAGDSARRVEVVIEDGLEGDLDPHLARVLVENLLGNAWKFTKTATAPRIEFGRTTDRGAQTFFVRDNGAGFDMAYANKLFAPFQRLHTVAEYPGTGIGLATVQRIVHRHNGRIWAEGAVNAGATFYFTVPIRTREATATT